MTATPQAGANWKGGGELRALHRIVPPVAPDDEEETAILQPPIGHNSKRHNISAALAAIEEKTRTIKRLLLTHERVVFQIGAELCGLRELWLAERQREMDDETVEWWRMKSAGLGATEIAQKVGVKRPTIVARLKYFEDGKKMVVGVKVRGVFINWAAEEFKLARSTIQEYMMRAGNPEKVLARSAESRKITAARLALGRLVQQKNATLATLKKAQLSLSLTDELALHRWTASRLYPRLTRRQRQELAEFFAELNALPVVTEGRR